MEIYNLSGKQKTEEIRVTRPVGALLFETAQPLSGLTNETITVFIERINGNNHNIATNVSLLHFMLGSAFGESAITTSADKTQALLDLAEEGYIALSDGESLKIKLDGLKSGINYALNTVEMPYESPTTVKFDRKPILEGETSKKIDCAIYDEVVIDDFNAVTEVSLTFGNGQTVKYETKELIALSRDVDPVSIIDDGISIHTNGSALTVSLIDVHSIEVQKTDGKVDCTFRDVNYKY